MHAFYLWFILVHSRNFLNSEDGLSILEALKREVAPAFRARSAQAKKRKFAEFSLKRESRTKSGSASAAAAATILEEEASSAQKPVLYYLYFFLWNILLFIKKKNLKKIKKMKKLKVFSSNFLVQRRATRSGDSWTGICYSPT